MEEAAQFYSLVKIWQSAEVPWARVWQDHWLLFSFCDG